MGSSISALYDDYDQYEFFCEKYKEDLLGMYDHRWLDHFFELRKRNNDERRNLHEG